MYPFKLAIEQVRIASVQWSPGREAGERTRVADERLEEVQSLFRLQMFTQLPGALKALSQAVVAAQVAVEEARREGELPGRVQARLTAVQAGGGQVAEQVQAAAISGWLPLTGETRQAVVEAVQESKGVLLPPPTTTPPPTAGGTPSQTTQDPPAAPSEPTTAPTQPLPTTPSPPPTTAPQPTNPPTTVPTTTVPPPPAEPPTTSSDPATPESPGDEGRDTTDLGKAGEQAPAEVEDAPPAAAP
jgi:hypothetical protein